MEKLKQLANDLDASGINYCQFKSTISIDRAIKGATDLDILVQRSDASEFCSILQRLNFKLCKSRLLVSYPAVVDFLGFDDLTGKIIHVHLHYELVTGMKFTKIYSIGFTKKLFENTTREPVTGLQLIDTKSELILLFIRVCLKYSRISFVDIKEILRERDFLISNLLESENNLDLSNNFLLDVNLKHVEEFLHVNLLSPNTLRKWRRDLKSRLCWSKRYNALQECTLRFTKAFLNKLWFHQGKTPIEFVARRTLDSGGACIVLVGIDGSGKSTHAKSVHSWLAWKLDTKSFYLGTGNSSLSLLRRFLRKCNYAMAFIKRIFQKKKKGKYTDRIGTGTLNDAPAMSRLGKLAYCFTVILINFERSWILKRIAKYRMRGGIVILDRFPQNCFNGISDGPLLQGDPFNSALYKPFQKLEQSFFQKVTKFPIDILIQLKVTPDVAFERKKGDLNTLKCKSEVIDSATFGSTKTQLIIDASASEDTIRLQIQSKLWELL